MVLNFTGRLVSLGRIIRDLGDSKKQVLISADGVQVGVFSPEGNTASIATMGGAMFKALEEFIPRLAQDGPQFC